MTFPKLTLSALIIAGAFACSQQASAIQIDNTVITNSASPFGTPDTATYGQTFTVGAENVLNNFTMYLGEASGGAGLLSFRGYVGSWDGSKVGSILYTSDILTKSAREGQTEYLFDTHDLSLASGQQYVMFLSVSDVANRSTATFRMPTTGQTYAGGDFVYFNNGTNFSALTTTRWDCTSCWNGDAAFKASFSGAADVPEPASLALLGLGLAGLAMRRRKAGARAK